MKTRLVVVVAALIVATAAIGARTARADDPFVATPLTPDSQITSDKSTPAEPPIVAQATCMFPAWQVFIAPGANPANGYLPLSSFGIPPIPGTDDDTVT